MEFNDFQLLNEEQIKSMAKEYNKSLKEKGFIFVNSDENINKIIELDKLLCESFNNFVWQIENAIKLSVNSRHKENLKKILTVAKQTLNKYINDEIKTSNSNLPQNYCEALKNAMCFYIETVKLYNNLSLIKGELDTHTINIMLDLSTEIVNNIGVCKYRK